MTTIMQLVVIETMAMMTTAITVMLAMPSDMAMATTTMTMMTTTMVTMLRRRWQVIPVMEMTMITRTNDGRDDDDVDEENRTNH